MKKDERLLHFDSNFPQSQTLSGCSGIASCDPIVKSRILQKYNDILSAPEIDNPSFFALNYLDDFPIIIRLSSVGRKQVSQAKRFLRFTATQIGTVKFKLLKTPTIRLEWLQEPNVLDLVHMSCVAEPLGDVSAVCYVDKDGRKVKTPLTGQFDKKESIVKRPNEPTPTSILPVIENLRALNKEMSPKKIIQEQIARGGPYIWTIPSFGLLVRNLQDSVKAALQLQMHHCKALNCNFFRSLENREPIPEYWKKENGENKNKKVPAAICQSSGMPCPLGVGLQPSFANNYFIHNKTRETERGPMFPNSICLRMQFVEIELLRLSGVFVIQMILWYLGHSRLETHVYRYLRQLAKVETTLLTLEPLPHEFLLLKSREVARNLIIDLKDLFHSLKIRQHNWEKAKSIKRVLGRMNYSHPLHLIYEDLEELVTKVESVDRKRIPNQDKLSKISIERILLDIKTILQVPRTEVHDFGMPPKKLRPAYMWLWARTFHVIIQMTIQNGRPPKRVDVIKEIERLHPKINERTIRYALKKLQVRGFIMIEHDGTCRPILTLLDIWLHDDAN